MFQKKEELTIFDDVKKGEKLNKIKIKLEILNKTKLEILNKTKLKILNKNWRN